MVYYSIVRDLVGLVGYAKLPLVDDETMENIGVVDQGYQSLKIGILTASIKCNVFLLCECIALKSNMNQDFAGNMFYQLAQK